MKYKCENNVIEQIDEISLTSKFWWIGYATISNTYLRETWLHGSGFKTENDRYNKQFNDRSWTL